ncbi:MAG: response regulator transcription factor [Defluviitaleaceae bacterium]|nr:response regulator transcription factor [Defluviitaleaceae bacterium]
MAKMTKIYLVEDDEHIRELVLYALNSGEYEAMGFESGTEFFSAFKREKPDLIILDIMLPGEDGLSILKTLRKTHASIPVIMLTAKSSEYDKIYGLEQGADDYVTKPFSVLELVSRIKAVLRRSGKAPEPEVGEVITYAGIVMDVPRHTVDINGEPLTLALKEFELLKCLLQNRTKVLSRDNLLDKVWQHEYGCESRTVDMHVRMLRKKLGGNSDLIETVRGVGYRMKEC